MSWLNTLGFLGLISIAVLVIIYILKPNYVQKTISSSYVWKLSLRLQKKKRPINKIRRILILICQILIFSISSMMLAQPIVAAEKDEPIERIAILDASAAMRAGQSGETRFDRAIAQIIALGHQTVKEKGLFSVILTDAKVPYIKIMRTDSADTIDKEMQGLLCTYETSDISGAMKQAEIILAENPNAEVLLYTSKSYEDEGDVIVKNLSRSTEWNAAIVNFSATFTEGYYLFAAEIACYGKDVDLDIILIVDGVEKQTIAVECRNDKSKLVEFRGPRFNNEYQGLKINEYSYAEAYIMQKGERFFLDDSFEYDNYFFLYAKRETLRVQYASSAPSTFLNGMITAFLNSSSLSSKWKFDITLQSADKIELTGYDLYIIESMSVKELPKDGVVWLVDPLAAPTASGLTFGSKISGDFVLSEGVDSPIMNLVRADVITVSEYTRINAYDGYEALMYCSDDPTLLIKDTPTEKVAIIPFDLHQSNLPILLFDFPALLTNLFNYFIPATTSKRVFNMGDTIELNARSKLIKVEGPEDFEAEYDDFPQMFSPKVLGLYTVTQTPISGLKYTEQFFVKISETESNFTLVQEKLSNPMVFEKDRKYVDLDLLIYFASALVALLFIEWLLHSREQI